MRRLGLALATGVLVAGAALGGAASAEEERGVRRFESQVANLEDAIGRLVREFANPLAIVRKFPHQTRLIDARVFYDLGNYENAAIVLMDVLDDPAFRGDLEYESAELLLGQALLKIDNPKAARDQFSAVAKGRDAKLAEEARYYLIEMALSDGDTARLKELVAQFGGTASSDRTRFGLGKAYLQLNDPDKAILWLKVVSPQSEFFTRARYYLGAAYTAKKQYTDALSIFSGLTGGPRTTPRRRRSRISRGWPLDVSSRRRATSRPRSPPIRTSAATAPTTRSPSTRWPGPTSSSSNTTARC